MVYRSISQTQFIPVEACEGTHEWIDGNNNQLLDLNDPTDFEAVNQGNYSIQTIGDALSGVNWTFTSYLWLFGAFLFMVSRDFFYMVRIRLLTKNKLTWKASFYVIIHILHICSKLYENDLNFVAVAQVDCTANLLAIDVGAILAAQVF